MIHAVFLCDKQQVITRLLSVSPELSLAEGSGLFALLAPGTPGPKLGEKYSAVTLCLPPKGLRLPALSCEYPETDLVVAGRVESAADAEQFNELCARCLAWAQESLQELFTDDYIQIQRMNNQLINSQRALMKSNQRLKKVLAQVQSANDTISLLAHDALTGLYRPAAFFRKVQHAVEKAPGAAFDIIVLDVEHFTLVCDVFGLKTGNQLLQALALQLTALPHADHGYFAHAENDIFYIYMPAQYRFWAVLDEKLPAFFENYPLPIRMHAKLGVYTADSAEVTPLHMCDRARLALNTLTGREDTRVAHYDRSLHEDLLREHLLLDSVPDALRGEEFLLYLQPKIDMMTGRVIGAEALIRWQSPALGFISPGEFVPLLEREGAMYQVDQFLWEKACQFLAERRARGLPPLPVSINVARGDFYQPDLLDVLEHLLEKYSLEPALLRLEIIERAYTEDTDRIVRILSQLRERGFLIEMDDFGTGASSLAMAADMPVDVLKLDRSFLTAFPDSPRHVEVVRFAVHLAQALQLELIAEGVETQAQAKALRELGCRYAQGFFYGRPEPADHFFHS